MLERSRGNSARTYTVQGIEVPPQGCRVANNGRFDPVTSVRTQKQSTTSNHHLRTQLAVTMRLWGAGGTNLRVRRIEERVDIHDTLLLRWLRRLHSRDIDVLKEAIVVDLIADNTTLPRALAG